MSVWIVLRVCTRLCARRDFCVSDPDCLAGLTISLAHKASRQYFHSHASRELPYVSDPHLLHPHPLKAMASRLAPVTKPIFRAQLSSKQSNGHASFVPQVRKLVFEYSQNWASSANTRTYLQKTLQSLAHANPHVEVVVKQRNNRQPIVRGFYRAPFPYFGLLPSR